MGGKTVSVRAFISNFPNTNLYFSTREHVYTKDTLLCIFISMHRWNSGLLEVKDEKIIIMCAIMCLFKCKRGG